MDNIHVQYIISEEQTSYNTVEGILYLSFRLSIQCTITHITHQLVIIYTEILISLSVFSANWPFINRSLQPDFVHCPHIITIIIIIIIKAVITVYPLVFRCWTYDDRKGIWLI